jgi:hypothetical protein
MTTRQFVEGIFNDCREGAKPITVEEAENDISNFKNEGWEMPKNITAEEYSEIWNGLI